MLSCHLVVVLLLSGLVLQLVAWRPVAAAGVVYFHESNDLSCSTPRTSLPVNLTMATDGTCSPLARFSQGYRLLCQGSLFTLYRYSDANCSTVFPEAPWTGMQRQCTVNAEPVESKVYVDCNHAAATHSLTNSLGLVVAAVILLVMIAQ